MPVVDGSIEEVDPAVRRLCYSLLIHAIGAFVRLAEVCAKPHAGHGQALHGAEKAGGSKTRKTLSVRSGGISGGSASIHNRIVASSNDFDARALSKKKS
jgi:hypothetical protein